ncbi:Metallo-dependent phosphatase [Dichomitus squalens LYAD-421 SS1]|uniref:Metallo-dependent phosphatase n=1 Tax=Dichomitus squalens (strain LYAD-421) TaxID=732165 RepID=UPI000441197B|nr:Metallo-dependent phosphatase [Dichomitus squalens LYAD-421 SS1]EJF65103.1 Metallo-dependent phosphatase [Dichomitus squalens LYAD-421 SS1]
MVLPRLVNFARLVWLLLVAWYELGVFYSHASSCPWPDETLRISTTSITSPTHVLIVADPQILDRRSYPDRPPWLVRLSQLIVDLNLRKSWRGVLRQNPHAVVFLGDMMDNGRFAMSDDEYEKYFRRFKSIFAADENLPVYYLPGNHDIGLGASSPRYQFSDHALERYVTHFGALNQRIILANHTVYMIDAPGLVDEELARVSAGMSYSQWAEARPDRTVAYLQSAAQSVSADPDQPTLLFTHVPLFRPEHADCGPLRERGTIRQGRGLGYQNLLTEQASRLALQSLRPAIIFSGDDHDYCEHVHTVPVTDTKRPSPPLSVPEITVKSFSMAMGVRHPGYQLLSLVPPSTVGTSPSFAHQPCLLPDQLGIYLNAYLPLLSLTLIVLFAANVRRVLLRHRSGRSGDSLSIPLASSTEEDDVNYDLPPPSAWRSKDFPRAAWSRSCTFVLGGQVRRVTLSLPGLVRLVVRFLWSSGGGGRDSDSARRRDGIVKGFTRDFLEAAWAPVALFVAIAWWVW